VCVFFEIVLLLCLVRGAPAQHVPSVIREHASPFYHRNNHISLAKGNGRREAGL